MAWLTGFPDSSPLVPRGLCDPLAGLHAAFAALVALADCQATGRGHLVEATMVEAALNVAAEVVLERQAYGATLVRQGNRGPVAAPQGVYRCAGAEQWLALAVVDDQQWRAVGPALGHPEWVEQAAWATVAGRRADHDALDRHLAEALAQAEASEVAERLSGAGVPAEAVVVPAWVTANPQMLDRGFIQRVDHPLLGALDLYGLPYRFASQRQPWIRRPAPTLGQDNAEVLTGLLGLTPEDLAVLVADQVISDRLVGG
jgi:crotonobetainyl-CoA:carnitine CoA-transferase CaiB-like acyl-CoA transferase